MKPWHILLLVAAGAAGGAMIMKVVQRPRAELVASQEIAQTQPTVQAVQQTPQAAASAAEQPPTERPPTEQAAVPPAAPEATSHPSPFAAAAIPAPREAPRPGRVHRRIPPAVIAQNRPNATAPPAPTLPAAAAAAPTPAPATVPANLEPAPPPISPARPEPEHVTPPPATEPNRVTLNAGMLIPVRLVDGLSSERSMPGDTFIATLDKELVVDGFVIAERGARVEGRVVASDRGGRVKGVAGMAVELTRLRTSDGQDVAIQTDSFEKRAEQTQRQDAEKVAAGAAIGAVIGAVAGGGKGAAIGAGVGGGAGAGDVLLTRGNGARLPSETRISFRLRAPVTLTERTPG